MPLYRSGSQAFRSVSDFQSGLDTVGRSTPVSWAGANDC